MSLSRAQARCPVGPVRGWAVAALLALVGLPGPGAAQTDFRQGQIPSPPPYYAIQNARIVTVSGRTIERGTVVLERGVITAVGANVQVPPAARIIDGTGLTVYPGLVDALTTLGHPPARGAGNAAAAGGPGGRGGGPNAGGGGDRSWGPDDRPATTPWVSAADDVDPDDDRIARWRSAGFTTTVSSPDQGFFAGQAAVLNLAGFRGRDMVVKAPAALRTSLEGGRGHSGYPNSLMGSIAYLRQTFMDADHYGRAWSVYNGNPRGLARPEFDETLAPIHDALQGGWPVLFQASSAVQIRRALALGREVGANVVIYGAHQGYGAAADLAAAGAKVLVSLDFPKAPRDGDPDAEPSLAQLRLRERAPTTPGALASAGVEFAFYSDGVSNPSDALDNVRLAVAAGLSRDAAIRALTLSPARIFGVADRTGSIEVGKIGNLVVTEGDLFDAGTRVRMTFVDGRMYEPAPPRMADRGNGQGRPGGQGGQAGQGEQAQGEGAEGRGGQQTREITWEGVTPVTPIGPYAEADVWIVRNATIMTGTGQTIENGSIIVRNGKIAQVGQNLSAPGGAREIDASGKYVIPGIIDAHSHIAADAINEGSVSVSAMVGIEDVLDPEDVGIYRAAAGGVTTINLLHGSANPIGGKNAVLKMRWGSGAPELLFDGAPRGIKFALGENPSRTRTPARYPNTRMGVMDVIRQAFVDAQEYRTRWQDYEARRARGEQNLIPPRRDLKLDALVEIMAGERLVHAHSYRGDEILQLLRLAEEFGFRIATFQHVLEGYKVADEIAAHGAGASTFSDWWAYKVEAYDAIPYNGALMTERGVVVSINSDSGEEMRHLNQEAAKTMKWGGLDEHQALALVTINPARQLGIEDRVGSIEVGKDADLVIYDGHPLSIFSTVEKTMIDGKIYFDKELDRERQAALEREKAALLEKQRTGPRSRPVTDDLISPGPGGAR